MNAPDDPNVPPTWTAPPGTSHRYCNNCGHWFASRGSTSCLTCTSSARRTGRSLSEPTPFLATGSSGRRIMGRRP